ncbi:hypothetical protein ABEF93_000374 [Exophiala dermatitidis]
MPSPIDGGSDELTVDAPPPGQATPRPLPQGNRQQQGASSPASATLELPESSARFYRPASPKDVQTPRAHSSFPVDPVELSRRLQALLDQQKATEDKKSKETDKKDDDPEGKGPDNNKGDQHHNIQA